MRWLLGNGCNLCCSGCHTCHSIVFQLVYTTVLMVQWFMPFVAWQSFFAIKHRRSSNACTSILCAGGIQHRPACIAHDYFRTNALTHRPALIMHRFICPFAVWDRICFITELFMINSNSIVMYEWYSPILLWDIGELLQNSSHRMVFHIEPQNLVSVSSNITSLSMNSYGT